MKALIVGLVFTAGCLEPQTGSAFWQSSTSDYGHVPDGSSIQAYSERGRGGRIVRTVGNDESVGCSAVESIAPGGLTAVFNDRALQSLGDVPITAEPQVAEVASAQLFVGDRHYTGGTMTITDLDGTINATFVAKFEQKILTGWFEATHCP